MSRKKLNTGTKTEDVNDVKPEKVLESAFIFLGSSQYSTLLYLSQEKCRIFGKGLIGSYFGSMKELLDMNYAGFKYFSMEEALKKYANGEENDKCRRHLSTLIDQYDPLNSFVLLVSVNLNGGGSQIHFAIVKK